jgi:cell division septation protein DedD
MTDWERPSLSSDGNRPARPRSGGTSSKTKPGRLRWVLILVALVAIGGFSWMAWSAYKSGGNGVGGIVPMIKADNDPTRIRPDDPGGMPVPNQDKAIYDKLDPRNAPPQGVERLLPPPESPIDRPSAPVTPANPAPSKPSIPSIGESSSDMGAAREVGSAVVKAPVEKAAPPSSASQAPAIPSPFVKVDPPPAPAKTTTPAKPPAQTATATPVAPSKPAVVGGIRLQLGAVGSEDAAQKEWDRIKKANSDVLGSLSPNFVRADLGDKGVVYRIQAGPVATADAAADLCNKLRARSVGCFVAR